MLHVLNYFFYWLFISKDIIIRSKVIVTSGVELDC